MWQKQQQVGSHMACSTFVNLACVFTKEFTTVTAYRRFVTKSQLLETLFTRNLLTKVRSLLLGACNSYNKPMQRHFYRSVYF